MKFILNISHRDPSAPLFFFSLCGIKEEENCKNLSTCLDLFRHYVGVLVTAATVIIVFFLFEITITSPLTSKLPHTRCISITFLFIYFLFVEVGFTTKTKRAVKEYIISLRSKDLTLTINENRVYTQLCRTPQ